MAVTAFRLRLPSGQPHAARQLASRAFIQYFHLESLSAIVLATKLSGFTLQS